jgi:hypothetical protein
MATPDLLTPIVSDARLNRHFRFVATSPGYAPARPLLRDVWHEYVDRDGNFVEQFQTSGFDARTWELFLFVFLHDDAQAEFEWDHAAPDFPVRIKGTNLYIEAVTANLSQLENVVVHEAQTTDPVQQMHNLYPIRLGSALYSKLQKRYWDLPHVAGKPLVFAIQDFPEPESLYHSSASLWQDLYGIRGSWYHDEVGRLHIEEISIDAHVHGSKRIPSGFFQLPDADHVSAVLFGNSGTIAKFNRLGYLLGHGRKEVLKIIRRGLRYNHTPNSTEPTFFAYALDDADAPLERWSQGLTLFHNPKALHPLPYEILSCAYGFMDNSVLRTFLPDFHPFVSQTVTLIAANKEIPEDPE